MQNNNVNPTIIIGMHRSGTSLVTRLLHDIGLFTGRYLDPNHEALFFFQINSWLFELSGASWANPTPVRDLLADNFLHGAAKDYLEKLMQSPAIRTYLGNFCYLRNHSLFRLPFSWGWKDPKNTFTLPLWMELFPDARIIHVKRHGVDVAQSMVARRRHEEETATAFLRQCGPWSRRFIRRGLKGPKGMTVVSTPKCKEVTSAFDVWETYTLEASRHVNEFGAQAFEIRYEDLLDRPTELLSTLAEFCGLSVTANKVEEAVNTIDASRGTAFRADGQLKRYAQSVTHRLSALGYN